MQRYEDLKRVFEESFAQVPYKKITCEEYDAIRKEKAIIFYPAKETGADELKIEELCEKIVSEIKNNEICFVINYSVRCDNFSAVVKLTQIPEKITNFIDSKNYKDVHFYLCSELKNNNVFSGTFLGYAQI